MLWGRPEFAEVVLRPVLLEGSLIAEPFLPFLDFWSFWPFLDFGGLLDVTTTPGIFEQQDENK